MIFPICRNKKTVNSGPWDVIGPCKLTPSQRYIHQALNWFEIKKKSCIAWVKFSAPRHNMGNQTMLKSPPSHQATDKTGELLPQKPMDPVCVRSLHSFKSPFKLVSHILNLHEKENCLTAVTFLVSRSNAPFSYSYPKRKSTILHMDLCFTRHGPEQTIPPNEVKLSHWMYL